MTSAEETAALVALVRRGDAPWPEIADRVERAGSALAVLKQAQAPGGQQALFPADDEDLSPIIAELARWHGEGLRLVTVLDEDYPRRLRLIHQRPPFLFVHGRLALDELAVAVVGTRKPTPQGVRYASEIAGGLAARGAVVVSGLATGIDTAAHRAALHAGGRTVAVIGTGIRRTYPAANADLQHQIGESGLVLSQFWPDSPPTKQSFPLRNATMSGYSLATVVIEAAERSGARMQARFALEHGRHVFLLRSLLRHEWARDYAQRPNTTVVDGPDDVFGKLDHLRSTIDDLAWT